MDRHFYGFEWRPYGVCSDDAGRPIGVLVVFTSRRDRDRWVAEAGHIPRTTSGCRQAVPSSWRKYQVEP